MMALGGTLQGAALTFLESPRPKLVHWLAWGPS